MKKYLLKNFLYVFFLLINFYSYPSRGNDLNEVMHRYKELNEARERYTQSVYEMMGAQESRVLRQYWKEEGQEQIEKTQRDNKEARKKLLETLKNHIGGEEVFSLMILIENHIYYRYMMNMMGISFLWFCMWNMMKPIH